MDDPNIPPTATVYTCGLCGPQNPGGHGGWGFTMRDAGQVLLREGQGRVAAGAEVTNNVVEYVAVGMALRAYGEVGTGGVLLLRTSARLVVEQMCGRWPAKKGAYVKAYETVRNIVAKCPFEVRWAWVPQEQNLRAVGLAADALAEIGVIVAAQRR